jgi:polyhydroxyalkanoate synthesis repressor PhaR
MTDSEPTIIKKYANRRLYDTGTSTYVTLDDLARMVRDGQEFVVQDARSGEDITRAVLGQIIFDLENQGQHLLPIAFLRQLIRFYGDSMQAVLPTYLETALAAFIRNQDELRQQFTGAMPGNAFGLMEEQARRNMELFTEAMRMWMPFPGSGGEAPPRRPPSEREQELEELRRQLRSMQEALDTIAKKG